MLTTQEQELTMRVLASLQASKDKAQQALAVEVQAMVHTDIRTKAAIGDAARSRSQDKPGKQPSQPYVVELNPGWRMGVLGAKAAHAALEQALTELGNPKRLPTPQSLAVRLSSAGHWHCLVDTADGTVSVSVRKPTPAELKLAQ